MSEGGKGCGNDLEGKLSGLCSHLCPDEGQAGGKPALAAVAALAHLLPAPLRWPGSGPRGGGPGWAWDLRYLACRESGQGSRRLRPGWRLPSQTLYPVGRKF